MPASMALLQAYPELFFALLCFVFLYLYLQLTRHSVAPVNWPLAGMLPGLLFHLHCLHDWVTNILRQTGCTFLFRGPWLMDQDYLVTIDPANLQHLFNINFPNYPKGEEFSDIFDILGDGIFNADAEAWKKQRMRAHALMSGPKFRAFVARASLDKVQTGLLPLVSEIASRGAAVDLQDVFLRLTFDMTSFLVFGVDPRCLSTGFPTVPFARAMDDAMGGLFMRHIVPPTWWKLMRRMGIGMERKMAAAATEIDRFIADCVAEKKKVRRGLHSGDLLSSYMSEDGLIEKDSDYKFLRDTAVNFMLAGRDTTGAALSWFFWMLYKNPASESRILEELKGVVHEKDRPGSDGTVVLEAEEVGQLVYLHAALCEALRLFPPVPFEHKAAVQPEALPSGHKVKRGTKIVMPFYSMARMEGIWGKDCEEFKPERWISDKGKIRHEPSYKFISFNSGPRTCLGKEVAFTQMKVAAAALVYNFRVEVVEGHVVEPKHSIILHMKNGLHVRIKRRLRKPNI